MTTNGTGPSDLVTLGEAALIADVPVSAVTAAITARRLPFKLSVYEQGSHASRIRISRSALEKFAGAERLRAAGNRDLAAMDIMSLCGRSGCRRFSPGDRCDRHGGRHEALPRPLSGPERTAHHEAGHMAIARTLRWPTHEASIVNEAGSFGHVEYEASPPDTLARIADHLAFALAGPIAASMARREDWRKLNIAAELAHEEQGDELLRAACAVRFGGDEAGARAWLSAETTKAGERAHRILSESWSDVSYLALKLLRHLKIGAAA